MVNLLNMDIFKYDGLEATVISVEECGPDFMFSLQFHDGHMQESVRLTGILNVPKVGESGDQATWIGRPPKVGILYKISHKHQDRVKLTGSYQGSKINKV